MRREHRWLEGPSGAGGVIVYGSYGRPVVAFPSESGRCEDFERNGMVAAIADLVESGRVKLYCVDSFDAGSWADRSIPLEERARRHGAFEAWIVEQVVSFVDADCGGRQEMLLTGCSLGAYHAGNFALRRGDLFPLALCLSGVYDLSHSNESWGDRGDAFYFNNPMDYVANLSGDHLDWLRSRVSLLLVCGQGQWEDTTGALDSTLRFAQLLREKGLRHELDVWGFDVPHDWPSWRAQLAHHLPRFV